MPVGGGGQWPRAGGLWFSASYFSETHDSCRLVTNDGLDLGPGINLLSLSPTPK